jgi:hypothetical protein
MLNGVLPILTDDVRECKAVHRRAALLRNVDVHGLSLVRLGIPSWVDAAVHLQGPTVEGDVVRGGVVVKAAPENAEHDREKKDCRGCKCQERLGGRIGAARSDRRCQRIPDIGPSSGLVSYTCGRSSFGAGRDEKRLGRRGHQRRLNQTNTAARSAHGDSLIQAGPSSGVMMPSRPRQVTCENRPPFERRRRG